MRAKLTKKRQELVPPLLLGPLVLKEEGPSSLSQSPQQASRTHTASQASCPSPAPPPGQVAPAGPRWLHPRWPPLETPATSGDWLWVCAHMPPRARVAVTQIPLWAQVGLQPGPRWCPGTPSSGTAHGQALRLPGRDRAPGSSGRLQAHGARWTACSQGGRATWCLGNTPASGGVWCSCLIPSRECGAVMAPAPQKPPGRLAPIQFLPLHHTASRGGPGVLVPQVTPQHASKACHHLPAATPHSLPSISPLQTPSCRTLNSPCPTCFPCACGYLHDDSPGTLSPTTSAGPA